MKLLFTGDLCPIGINEPILSDPTSQEIADKKAFFEQFDLVAANLECPLCDENAPIAKYGPNLRASTKVAQGVRALGIDCATLANNHIYDQGDVGMRSTLDALDAAGIARLGGGMNLDEASRPYLIERDGEKICLLACADQEFNMATPTSGGANPYDECDIVRALLAQPKDAVKIVSIHGGNEHLRIPPPRLRKFCRLLIELGADLVVCCHSHCIGAAEKYKDGEIYYSLGNFLFSKLPQKHRWIKRRSGSDAATWKRGIFLSVEIDKGRIVSTEPIPFAQNAERGLFDVAQGELKSSIDAEFQEACATLADEAAYERAWLAHCNKMKRVYDGLLVGGGRLYYLLSKFGIDPGRLFQTERGRANIGLTHRCLAHTEVIKTLYSLKK